MEKVHKICSFFTKSPQKRHRRKVSEIPRRNDSLSLWNEGLAMDTDKFTVAVGSGNARALPEPIGDVTRDSSLMFIFNCDWRYSLEWRLGYGHRQVHLCLFVRVWTCLVLLTSKGVKLAFHTMAKMKHGTIRKRYLNVSWSLS